MASAASLDFGSSDATRAGLSQEAAAKTASQLNSSPLCPSVYSDCDGADLKKTNEKLASQSCSLRNIIAILWAALVEGVLVGMLLVIPAALAYSLAPQAVGADPHRLHGVYNPFLVKQNSEAVQSGKIVLQPALEFVRCSLFWAWIYGGWVMSNAVVRVLPLLARRSYHAVAQAKGLSADRVRIPYQMKTALAGYKASRHALSVAFAAIWGIFLFDSLMWEGSALLSSATHLTTKGLSLTAAGFTSSTLAKAIEHSLLLLAAGTLLFALERWWMQSISADFHSQALACRIRASNFKFRVLQRLHRLTDLDSINARHSLVHAARQDQLRASVGLDEDDLVQVASDSTGLNIHDEPRVRQIGAQFWAALCPHEREYLVEDDLRPYFTDDDRPAAFRVFDPRLMGILNKASFIDAVVLVWRERENLRESVTMTDGILKVLNSILQTVMGVLWAMSAMWYLNPAGYQWIMSASGFILAFGFMFKDTFKRTFESFCFILAEHPYDVGDVVSIDGSLYTVVKIEIFTTIFRKEPDSLLTYIPNCTLATKSIHNLQRSAMALDTLLLTLPASTSMSKIGELQGRIRDFLSRSVPEFTGHVQIVPFELKEEMMNVRVESRYQDPGAMSLDQKLPQSHVHAAEVQISRKNNLAQYIEGLLSELSIT